jgi:hypothetical protein
MSRPPNSKKLALRSFVKPVPGVLEVVFGNWDSVRPDQQDILFGQIWNRPQNKPVPLPTLLNGMNVRVQVNKRAGFRAASTAVKRLKTTHHTGFERVTHSLDDFGRQQIGQVCTPGDWVGHGFKISSNNRLLHLLLNAAVTSAKFISYLASPRAGTKMSGLYLHSPASEGMWMGALQKHTGKVCLRLPFPI